MEEATLAMRVANRSATNNEYCDFTEGGPFGAVIMDSKGNMIAWASNSVLEDNDPTAHAEINAIRAACESLSTHDLSGCTLYTTCYPCPMCLGAIIWSNIKTVYYGNTREDAAAIGFRDDMIYKLLEEPNSELWDKDVLTMQQEGRDLTIKLFESYAKSTGKKEY